MIIQFCVREGLFCNRAASPHFAMLKSSASNGSQSFYVQAKQAEQLPVQQDDNSLFTNVLTVLARGSLLITVLLAGYTMFFSAGMEQYVTNRTLFFNAGFSCTLAYFASAYWAMKRRQRTSLSSSVE